MDLIAATNNRAIESLSAQKMYRPYRELCAAIIICAIGDLRNKNRGHKTDATSFIFGEGIEFWVYFTNLRISISRIRKALRSELKPEQKELPS